MHKNGPNESESIYRTGIVDIFDERIATHKKKTITIIIIITADL